LGPIPNPQSPIPNPQSPIPNFLKNSKITKISIYIYIILYKNYSFIMEDNSNIIIEIKKKDNLNIYKKGEHLENPNINAKTDIKKNIQRFVRGENSPIKNKYGEKKKY